MDHDDDADMANLLNMNSELDDTYDDLDEEEHWLYQIVEMYEVCIYTFSVGFISFIYLVFMFDCSYVYFKYIIVNRLSIGELRVMWGWGGQAGRVHLRFHLHMVGLFQQRIYYSWNQEKLIQLWPCIEWPVNGVNNEIFQFVLVCT